MKKILLAAITLFMSCLIMFSVHARAAEDDDSEILIGTNYEYEMGWVKDKVTTYEVFEEELQHTISEARAWKYYFLGNRWYRPGDNLHWYTGAIESERGNDSSERHLYYQFNIQPIDWIRIATEELDGVALSREDWYDYYMSTNFVNCNWSESDVSGEERTDGGLQTIIVNGITYQYITSEYDVTAHYYTGDRTEHYFWYRFITVFGDHAAEIDFAWMPGYIDLPLENSLDTAVQFLSTVHYPTIESGRDTCILPELLSGDYTGQVYEIKHRVNPYGAYVVEFTPDSGSGYQMTTDLRIKFNKNIKGYHYDAPDPGNDKGSCNIYICDYDTNEPVYWLGKNTDGKYLGGQISYYRDTLKWDLPNNLNRENPFLLDHTYYLVIDPSFLEFEGPEEVYQFPSNYQKWTFTVRRGTKAYTFDYSFYDDLYDKEGKNDTLIDQCTINEDWFFETSYQYESHLAAASMCMALSANNAMDYTEGYRYAEEFLKKAKFEGLEHNDCYESRQEINSIGVQFGYHNIDDVTLIAIAIRGGGYRSEWGGDFLVGDSSQEEHQGFSIAKQQVIDELQDYINRHANDMKAHLKFWVAGYSRAAATANLVAAELDRGIPCGAFYYEPKDVFAYCFEVPGNTTASDVGDNKFANIFNIINPDDVVPKVPLEQWGFSRYGTNMILPVRGTNKEWSRFIYSVKQYYTKVTASGNVDPLPEQGRLLNELIDIVSQYVTRDLFVQKLENKIVSSLDRANDYNEWNNDTPVMLLCDIASKLLGNAPYIAANTDWEKMLSDAEEILQHPDRTKEDIKNLLRKENLDKIAFQHHAEWTLAWMQTLVGSIYGETHLERNTHSDVIHKSDPKYTFLFVGWNCPVDVYLYDQDGGLVAVIYDSGEITLSEEDSAYGYINETGAKVFVLPTQSKYHFEAVPSDEGAMTVNIMAMDSRDERVLRIDNYLDLELAPGKNYELDVDSGLEGTDYTAEMVDSDEFVIEPDYSSDKVTDYLITTKAVYRVPGEPDEDISDLGLTITRQTVTAGTYVGLTAGDLEGRYFQGWEDYTDFYRNIVSKDQNFVFRVDKEWYLIAVYSDEPPQEEPETSEELTKEEKEEETVSSETGSETIEEEEKYTESASEETAAGSETGAAVSETTAHTDKHSQYTSNDNTQASGKNKWIIPVVAGAAVGGAGLAAALIVLRKKRQSK